MHILYLHQYFVPPDGIGGTRSYEIARRLVREGHSVTIITTRAFMPGHYFAGQPSRSVIAIEGIRIMALDVPYSNKFSYAKRIFSFLRYIVLAAREAVLMRDVDVIYATSTPLTIAIPALAAKLRHRRPLVFEIRDLWPELPIAVGALKNPVLIWLAKRLERTAYSYSDRIIALSPGMKKGIVQTGYPERNVTIIPNGCDIELFKVSAEAGKDFLEEHTYLKGGPLVVYAGTLGLINGVEYLVEIAAEMKKIEPAVRFLIAGDGKQKQKITEMAGQLGVLNKNLWIIPPVPKHHMPGLLSACTLSTSLFVDLPVMWNNSANKFFDALAAARPLMINYRGWQAKLLEQYGAGIVVPPGRPDAAARIVHEFLSDAGRCASTGKAAAALAQDLFDRETLFRQAEDVIRDAAATRTGRSGVWYRTFGKRAIDLALAVPLFMIALPLLAAVFAVVYLTMGRPVLFSQNRPGYQEKTITVHKIRTMNDDADASGRLLSDEKRLTLAGRFIRKFSLDELPQFWSVIKGDMSLVGPRPLLMEYLSLYNAEQHRRHAVRPGITGWAQVNGRNAISWQEKFKLDAWYVDNQSFRLDMKILWMTMVKVLRREGINQEGYATMEKFTGNGENS